MVESTDQIAAHIQVARDDLRSNLDELGDKVRSVTDWRHHYNNNPWLMLAAASGGGLLLSLMVSGRKRSTVSNNPFAPEHREKALQFSHEKTLLQKHFSDIAGALIGVAASQTKNVINKLLPGFGQHLPPDA